MSTSAEQRERLAAYGYDRAFAIFFSNLVLLGLMYFFWLDRWPSSFSARNFYISEWIVIIGTALLTPRGIVTVVADVAARAAKGFDSTAGGDGEREWIARIPQLRNGYALFAVLLPLIAVDLYGVGWRVNRTGGITQSPFAQLPFVMLVLGLVMAAQPVTQTILFAFGTGYVLLLTQTSALSSVNHDGLNGVKLVENTFVWVTLVALAVSYLVNLVARPARRSEPPLEIIEARYGADPNWVDVADQLREAIHEARLSVRVDNDLAGDPAPNVVKALDVEYRSYGRTRHRHVKETEQLVLP